MRNTLVVHFHLSLYRVGIATFSLDPQALGERPSHCLLLTYYAVVKVLDVVLKRRSLKSLTLAGQALEN
jgi:hypothetical protein